MWLYLVYFLSICVAGLFVWSIVAGAAGVLLALVVLCIWAPGGLMFFDQVGNKGERTARFTYASGKWAIWWWVFVLSLLANVGWVALEVTRHLSR